ncbi:MAG: cytochrome c biogenesis protein CcdA, partial [Bacteroidales bacterium]
MRHLLKKVTILLFLIITSLSAFAQDNPVAWSTKVKDLGDNIFQIIFEASIDDGWHVYDMGPYEGGPNATTFTFEQNSDIELIGSPEYITKPAKAKDELFGMVIGSFEKTARIGQKVKIKAAKATLKINVEWMACSNQSCIPPADQDFTIQLTGKIPVAAATGTDSDNKSQSQVETQTDDKSGNSTGNSTAVTTDNSTDAPAEPQEAEAISEPEEQSNSASIWSLILQALAWGIAALVTPCVFPMIPMTVSFFIKGSDNKAQGRFKAFMYGLFIVLLYTLPIALIIIITWLLGGDSVTADIFNWIATHWLPNIIFFIVFMVFAASFFGAFEIVLPSKLVNNSDRKSDAKGLGGVFFMALTLVLVSFSCTGPIVGTVLIKSTSGEFWAPILTMLAFSVAFALPFTLFALFPSWLKKLPKSGGWLNTVKVVLGFIEIALGLKFLSTADQTYQWGILDREVYLAIWIVVFTLLGFYLLGKLRFKHDSPVDHISVTRLTLAIISFSFVVYMLPGMWGAPLKAISGYLPPMKSQDFVLNTDHLSQNTTYVAQ